MLILIPGRPPSLLVSNVFLKFLAEELMWFREICFVKSAGFGQAVRKILDGVGCPRRRLGLIGREEMTVPVWEGLAKELPDTEWTDFAAEIDRRRTVKDALKLTFHRRAAEICDSIFETVGREVHNGQRTYQIQAEMERTARRAGAEYILTWLTIMPVADYSRFYKEECLRVPQKGDQILAGIYLIYDGHWGHAIRTGTFGTPTDPQRRIFDVALEMQEAGLAKRRPGKNLYDVNLAFKGVLERHFPDAKGCRRAEYSRVSIPTGFWHRRAPSTRTPGFP